MISEVELVRSYSFQLFLCTVGKNSIGLLARIPMSEVVDLVMRRAPGGWLSLRQELSVHVLVEGLHGQRTLGQHHAKQGPADAHAPHHLRANFITHTLLMVMVPLSHVLATIKHCEDSATMSFEVFVLTDVSATIFVGHSDSSIRVFLQ